MEPQTIVAPEETVEPMTREKRTWSGFWSGLICYCAGVLCIIAAGLIGQLILIVIESIRSGAKLTTEQAMELANQGDVLSIAFVLLLPMVIGLLSFLVRKRRKEPVLAYLGFQRVTIPGLLSWLLIAAGVVCIAFLSGRFFNRPEQEWFVGAYSSARITWLFWLAITVLAPISEELLYRGYIIKVWARSAIGPVFGTLLLSVLWAITHLQYDLYDMVWIGIFGIVLCMSRLRTQSIYPAMIIHSGINVTFCIDIIVSG